MMMMRELHEQARRQRTGAGRPVWPEEWTRWFAWYPVLGPGKILWLKTVEYRWDGSGYDPAYLYREVGGG